MNVGSYCTFMRHRNKFICSYKNQVTKVAQTAEGMSVINLVWSHDDAFSETFVCYSSLLSL